MQNNYYSEKNRPNNSYFDNGIVDFVLQEGYNISYKLKKQGKTCDAKQKCLKRQPVATEMDDIIGGPMVSFFEECRAIGSVWIIPSDTQKLRFRKLEII